MHINPDLDQSEHAIAEQNRLSNGVPPTAVTTELQRALGQEVHTWKSEDGSKFVTFGKPKGLISSKIARVLGPQQATNEYLQAMYRALLSIQTINAAPMFELYSESNFRMAEQWFETEDNWQSFFLAYQLAMNPEAAELIKQAREAGESPESMNRIAAGVGDQALKT